MGPNLVALMANHGNDQNIRRGAFYDSDYANSFESFGYHFRQQRRLHNYIIREINLTREIKFLRFQLY